MWRVQGIRYPSLREVVNSVCRPCKRNRHRPISWSLKDMKGSRGEVDQSDGEAHREIMTSYPLKLIDSEIVGCPNKKHVEIGKANHHTIRNERFIHSR